MKNVVIIPARGNSKRLPKKNIKLLNDIPLIVHSIRFAELNDKIVDKIIVSTDNEEIKDICLNFGVTVIDRPPEISGDNEPTVSALKHVLNSIQETYDNVILLQATNPLRPINLLKESFEIFCDGNYDSLFTVTRNHQKLGKIKGNHFTPFNYNIGQRSQDIEPLFYENGLLYITKSDLILSDKIIGDNHFSFIVNHPFAGVDIDTIEDFEYAEYLITKNKK